MAGEPETTLTPYERIRDGILSGEFASGQPLTENLLAKICNVSRTPIREALGRLERDGLVSWTERGTVVRERSPEEILDIYATRVVLEAFAAQSAAERRTETDVMMLRALAAQARQVADDADAATKLKASRDLHTCIRTASHNGSAVELLDRVNLQLARYANLEPTLSQPGRWQRAVEVYGELVEAIAARDAVRAGEISSAHFTEARELRMRALAGIL